MGFRDREVATQAQTDVLKREIAELRARNEQLEQGTTLPPAPQASGALRIAVALLVLAAASLGLAATQQGLPQMALVMLGVSLTLIGVLATLIGQLLIIVPPGRIVVLSGRPHTGDDGRAYRIVTGGRRLRIPILERMDELPAGPFRVAVSIDNAFARANRRVSIDLTAVVSVSRTEPQLTNAVERFLGQTPERIVDAAQDDLAGTARSVASEVSVDELQNDREKAADRILYEAARNLERLGLQIDSLHLHSVEATPGD